MSGQRHGVIIQLKQVLIWHEKGAIEGNKETKYGHGITPNLTYKKEVDELVPHKERMDWKGPRKQLAETELETSLMALMLQKRSHRYFKPSNGIEPSFVSVNNSSTVY